MAGSSPYSFTGLPLSQFGYGPITYSTQPPLGSGFAPFSTSGISGNPNPYIIRGPSIADLYLARVGDAISTLQGFAGGFDPRMFGALQGFEFGQQGGFGGSSQNSFDQPWI